MIYCNKRKEHIKPEVGQVWVNSFSDTGDQEKIVFLDGNYVAFKHLKSGKIHIHNMGLKISYLALIKEAPNPQSQWQPIETAPRDGTRIFAFGKPKEGGFEPYRTIIKYWQKYEIECDHYWEGGLKGDEPLLELNEYDGFHYFTENWYEEPTHEDGCVGRFVPTHWMPLPEPPESEDA